MIPAGRGTLLIIKMARVRPELRAQSVAYREAGSPTPTDGGRPQLRRYFK